jgi:hypothetical protein
MAYGDPFYTYGFGGTPIVSGYYGPATTVTNEIPGPLAPVLPGCASTPTQIAYVELFRRLQRRDITLLDFWLELVYNDTAYGVNNTAVRNGFRNLNMVGLPFASRRLVSSGNNRNAARGYPAFYYDIYSNLQPPNPGSLSLCAIPGSVAPLSFGTSFTSLPRPVNEFKASTPTLPATYAYTPLDCLTLATRAFENDFGANHSRTLTVSPTNEIGLADIVNVEMPDGTWESQRCVGAELNVTGRVATRTLAFNQLPISSPSEILPLEEEDQVEYYTPDGVVTADGADSNLFDPNFFQGSARFTAGFSQPAIYIWGFTIEWGQVINPALLGPSGQFVPSSNVQTFTTQHWTRPFLVDLANQPDPYHPDLFFSLEPLNPQNYYEFAAATLDTYVIESRSRLSSGAYVSNNSSVAIKVAGPVKLTWARTVDKTAPGPKLVRLLY